MASLSCKPLNSIPNTKNAFVFLLMLVWWFLMTITLSPPPVGCILTDTKPGIICKEIERQALLTLKAGFVDKAGRLSSWSDDNPNCCHWKGVSCSNHTGHVFKLNLRNPFEEDPYHPEDLSKYFQYVLEGEIISSSLLELKYLEYLDLSLNIFNNIPAFLGSLEELRYLNLSSSFYGVVPPSLGNLSRLEYLDLGSNYDGGLEVGILQWLTGMSSLTYLNLDWLDLSKAEGVDDWLGGEFNKLPNLLELHLRGCGLSNLPMSINHHPINFTSSLSILDLSFNNFSSSLSMPPWLFNLTGLVDLHLLVCSLAFNIPYEIGRLVALQNLDLSANDGMGGQLPASLGNLTNLEMLNLGFNILEGRIPVTLGHLCKLRELNLRDNRLEGDIHEFIDGLATCSSDHPHLETLDLSRNKLLGTLPSSLGSLSNLVSLDLSYNKMTIAEIIGRFPPDLEKLDLSYNQWRGQMLNESHFEKLTKLRELSLSATSKEGNLVLNVTQGWLPPFRRSLVRLELDGVKMSSKMFPRWTQTLRELEDLRLDDCCITDSIPTEF